MRSRLDRQKVPAKQQGKVPSPRPPGMSQLGWAGHLSVLFCLEPERGGMNFQGHSLADILHRDRRNGKTESTAMAGTKLPGGPHPLHRALSLEMHSADFRV